MKKIFHYLNKCSGCRCCELACSFHHARVFSPALSDIQVLRDNETGVIKWTINRSRCDFCLDEEGPLCLEYCAFNALKIREKKVV